MTSTGTAAPAGPEPGAAPGTPDPVAARNAMVTRLEAARRLGTGPVREALPAIRREALLPDRYRLHVTEDGGRRVSSPYGHLAWQLPASRPVAEGVLS